MNPMAIIFSFLFGVCFAGLLGYRLLVRYVKAALDRPELVVQGALGPLTDAQIMAIAKMLVREADRRNLSPPIPAPPHSKPEIVA